MHHEIAGYETIKVRFQDPVCFIQIDRPEANNTINSQLVAECHEALDAVEETATVVVLSGSREIFCFGGDFKALSGASDAGNGTGAGPSALYDLWLKLANSSCVTVSHVRGRANAGGLGFVAASDIVIADDTAQFSLSELLFGVYPACVLPFLIRRIGFQKANYLTLMTQPIPAATALEWGLVDAYEPQSEALLRRHLLRLRRLSKTAVRRYKAYVNSISGELAALKAPAVAGNLEVFSDPNNLRAIDRYVKEGLFPWNES